MSYHYARQRKTGFDEHRLQKEMTYIVFEDSKEFYEEPMDEKRNQNFSDPCRAYNKLQAEMKEAGQDPKELQVSCKKTGTAEVNGRKVEKYETRFEGDDSGSASVSYFDTELKIVIKETGDDQGHELKNIKVGGVSESSLAVPSGYKKLTEEQFTERILQQNQKKAKK